MENAGRPAAEIQKLQSDVTAMRRTLLRISDVQEEILTYVTKLKKCVEADQLEIGKRHMVRHILAHFLQF